MLKTRLIPCMLFNGFHIVKTVRFGEMRTLGNPTQFARVYNSRNVDELIFIDLAATQEKRCPNFDIIKSVSQECFMPLSIGGGIHNLEDVAKLMEIGADKVVINSEAIENPKFISRIAKKYGSQSLIVSIDAKKIDDKYFVFSDRGLKNTGLEISFWAKEVEKSGAGEIFLNSIDNDGMMGGFDLDLIKITAKNISIPIIACGGAGERQHIVNAIKIGNADAVSIASMFHYTEHTANSIKEFMAKAGIPTRLMREHYE